MKSPKEVNKLIAGVLGEPELYDVRENLRIVHTGMSKEAGALTVEEAVKLGADPISFTIITSSPKNYSGEIDHALYAAQRIAERNQCTFVLSFEDGVWKAAYGDYGDCSEYKGSNPAFATCVALLKYMRKI